MDSPRQLIELVRLHPFLYDVKHKDYKCLKKKKIAWKKIGDALNSNEQKCKTHWKTLRDCYFRCKKSERIVPDDVKRPLPKRKWKFYDEMSFLDEATSSKTSLKPNRIVKEEDKFRDTTNTSLDSDFSWDPPELKAEEGSLSSPMDRSVEYFSQEENETQDAEEVLFEFPLVDVTKTTPTTVGMRIEQNSTAQHFEILAKKIREANLPLNAINRIEAKISAVVFDEIVKHSS